MFNLTDSELESLHALNTTREIVQQPELWEETYKIYKKNENEIDRFLDFIFDKHKNLKIIFTGAGTSAYVGDTVTPYIKEKYKNSTIEIESVPTTSIVSNPYHYLEEDKPTLLFSFARSGNSPESIAAVEIAKKLVKNFYQMTITCSKEGKLAKNAEGDENNLVLLMPKRANDQGFAMTGAFTTMMLMTLLVLDRGDKNKDNLLKELVSLGRSVINRESQIKDIAAEKFDRIVYLGAGTLEGLSREAQLKMLELNAGEIVTAFESPLGFRHGPKSIVNEKTMLVLFNSTNEYTNYYDRDLLKELVEDNGALSIWSLDLSSREKVSPNAFLFELKVLKTIPDVYLALPYIMFAQALSLFTSVDRGHTPDNPSPTGTVNRVVKGVTIYEYDEEEG